jgi:hydroxymethylpyrimidine pyrophosphatase-like HAD family hydrolase
MEETIGIGIAIAGRIIKRLLSSKKDGEYIESSELYGSIFTRKMSRKQLDRLIAKIKPFKQHVHWLSTIEQCYETQKEWEDMIAQKPDYYRKKTPFDKDEGGKRKYAVKFKNEIDELKYKYHMLASSIPLDIRRMAKLG